MSKGLELLAALDAADTAFRAHLGCEAIEQIIDATDHCWVGDVFTLTYGPPEDPNRYAIDVIHENTWQSADLFAALVNEGCGDGDVIYVFDKSKELVDA